MKSMTPIFAILGLVHASPAIVSRQTLSSWQITSFSAYKGHLSGYCSFNFTLSSPLIPGPTICQAYADSGFSGSWWLATVGNEPCDNKKVLWTFVDSYQQGENDTGADLSVLVDGVRGLYRMPAEHITWWENNPNNPFDDDVRYTGPEEFEIKEFKEA